jgi:hypothetical protein
MVYADKLKPESWYTHEYEISQHKNTAPSESDFRKYYPTNHENIVMLEDLRTSFNETIGDSDKLQIKDFPESATSLLMGFSNLGIEKADAKWYAWFAGQMRKDIHRLPNMAKIFLSSEGLDPGVTRHIVICDKTEEPFKTNAARSSYLFYVVPRDTEIVSISQAMPDDAGCSALCDFYNIDDWRIEAEPPAGWLKPRAFFGAFLKLSAS